MKYFAVLSKENISIARDELLFLLNIKKHSLTGNILVFSTKKPDLFRRLAYTNQIYQYLFKTTPDNLIRKLQTFSFDSHIQKDYCVRSHCSIPEREISKHIYNSLKSPKVNLKDPATTFFLKETDQEIFAGKLTIDIPKGYKERMAHKRPALHPSSLHPKLARAMINLSGRRKGLLRDPFCGSGGILIEAGLMRIRAKGYDIDRIMISRSNMNLKHYNLKAEILQKDALTMDEKAEAVVTDPPYSKNTKKTDLFSLYKGFLKRSSQCTKTIVLSFPGFIDYEAILKPYRITGEYEIYIHKSMTKKVFVIRTV